MDGGRNNVVEGEYRVDNLKRFFFFCYKFILKRAQRRMSYAPFKYWHISEKKKKKTENLVKIISSLQIALHKTPEQKVHLNPPITKILQVF